MTASTDENREDAERRERLTRFVLHTYYLTDPKLIVPTRSLEVIEKRSLALLGKGKAARILDKKQDSGMVVKLVEELRQAILIYQVGLTENH